MIKSVLASIILTFTSFAAYAEQCPATLDPNHIPDGWTVVYQEPLSQPVVNFYYAFFNTHHNSTGGTVDPDGQHISCAYYDDNDDNYIEILSNKAGYPTPDKVKYPLWSINRGDNVIGWCNVIGGPVTPAQCAFGADAN